MNLQVFPSGPFETNAYVVFCEKTNEGAIVDPAPESKDKILQFVEQNKIDIKKILLTHSHWDHIGDVATLKEEFDVPVIIHPLDVPNLENPGADGLPLFMPIRGVKPDELLAEGDKIQIGEKLFEVIDTPGHTPGGVCFYCPEESILISGDTLFQGSIGNLSFPTSDPDAMWKSLEKLAQLPPETKVYPGHGPSTTIGAETWLNRAKEVFGY